MPTGHSDAIIVINLFCNPPFTFIAAICTYALYTLEIGQRAVPVADFIALKKERASTFLPASRLQRQSASVYRPRDEI